MKLYRPSNEWSNAVHIALVLLIACAVGWADYSTGYEMSLSVLYLLAIFYAFWRVGALAAVIASILSANIWFFNDWIGGDHYSNPYFRLWNAAVVLVFYLVVVALLFRVRSFQETLENRVRQRTAALTDEIAERERLEKEILAISEREQRRIGYDIHDGLCQHLTGTAIAGQVLSQKLAMKALPETADAEKVVALMEEGIALARNMALGLSPIQLEPQGLIDALRELALATKDRYKIACKFECATPVMVHDPSVAMHLYRIAQEAVSNAVRHGRAKKIDIRFLSADERILLMIEDDGAGLPSRPFGNKGMGLRIMQHRASMIGAIFDAHRRPEGGTAVTCSFDESTPLKAK